MRILGALCVRNEAKRYLARVLEWHAPFLDGIHVYDDQSSDATALVAANAGAVVDVRPNGVPSFVEHEGQFRQAAWEALELALQPLPGDWILAIDADEFFVSQVESERNALERLTVFAKVDGSNACRLRVDEIFDTTGGIPMRRVDGFWGDISASRFFRYQVRGHFANRQMGGGSVPTYINPCDVRDWHLGIQHYGYATPEDRIVKYFRYDSHRNNGHSRAHVQSILNPPTLARLTGERWP